MVISKKVIGWPPLAASQPVEHVDEPVLVDQLAGEPDALVEADQVRRDVGVNAPARRLAASARSMASVEPLPLVPATWTTGGSRRSGWSSAASSRSIRPSERSMRLGCSAGRRGEDQVTPQARIEPRPHAPRRHGRRRASGAAQPSTDARASDAVRAEQEIEIRARSRAA